MLRDLAPFHCPKDDHRRIILGVFYARRHPMLVMMAALLVCQGQENQENIGAFEAAKNDLEFQRATEDFVGPLSIPVRYRRAIDGLGEAHYRCRESASRWLEDALKSDPGASRWLFQARKHHKDLEVRLRCNSIIKRLSPCWRCKGSGVIGYNRGLGAGVFGNVRGFDDNALQCYMCGGFGSSWIWWVFD